MKTVITFGEIMLRLAPPRHERFVQARSFDASFGGGEANVAVALAGFGVDVDFVTRLPANELGDACLMELRKYGVGTRHVLRGGDRLGIYFLEVGAVQRPSKVLYDRAGSALAEIEAGMVDWDEVFDGAAWFHWTGITPAVSAGAAAACKEAARVAREMGLTVSCDLNYRSKLWRWGREAGDVMAEIVPSCDVILGNEEDAQRVFGIDTGELLERFPECGLVAETLRTSHSASHNSWTGRLFTRERVIDGPRYEITDIVDRVGGGDAFMAGLIYGLQRWPDDHERALAFATAASCLEHTIHGDFNLVSVAEVEKLIAGDASGRVER